MNKATEMVVGAFGGTIASEIMKLVIAEAKKVLAFKHVSKNLASTMENLRPIVKKIESFQRVEELKTLMDTIARGRDLVQKCSGVKRWKLLKKARYTRKVVKIQKEMVSFCQVQLQLLHHRNQLESMEEIKKLNLLMKEINISIKKFDDFMETVVGSHENTSSSRSVCKFPKVEGKKLTAVCEVERSSVTSS